MMLSLEALSSVQLPVVSLSPGGCWVSSSLPPPGVRFLTGFLSIPVKCNDHVTQRNTATSCGRRRIKSGHLGIVFVRARDSWVLILCRSGRHFVTRPARLLTLIRRRPSMFDRHQQLVKGHSGHVRSPPHHSLPPPR